jgi:hypothetical protein
MSQYAQDRARSADLPDSECARLASLAPSSEARAAPKARTRAFGGSSTGSGRRREGPQAETHSAQALTFATKRSILSLRFTL